MVDYAGVSLGQPGRGRAQAIRDFVLGRLVADEFRDITGEAAQQFGVSRQAVHKQLKRLEGTGLIEGRGRTKARVHRLSVRTSQERLKVMGVEEDTLWRRFVVPLISDVPQNVLSICHYGFTEIVNNVIDHSESEEMVVSIERTANAVTLNVTDFGIGVFRKIERAMSLPSLQEALFELTKGKITTDPARHTGEGLFYTSRAFDRFDLLSGGLFLSHKRDGDDWLIGSDDRTKGGTMAVMNIESKSQHRMEEVFEYYAAARDDYAFSKTNVALRLLHTGDDSFVSRSQAKRALARLPRFKEVLLDFEGVKSIGPAFADEVFRVFANEHPEVHLTPIRMSEEVQRMIARTARPEA